MSLKRCWKVAKFHCVRVALLSNVLETNWFSHLFCFLVNLNIVVKFTVLKCFITKQRYFIWLVCFIVCFEFIQQKCSEESCFYHLFDLLKQTVYIINAKAEHIPAFCRIGTTVFKSFSWRLQLIPFANPFVKIIGMNDLFISYHVTSLNCDNC